MKKRSKKKNGKMMFGKITKGKKVTKGKKSKKG